MGKGGQRRRWLLLSSGMGGERGGGLKNKQIYFKQKKKGTPYPRRGWCVEEVKWHGPN